MKASDFDRGVEYGRKLGYAQGVAVREKLSRITASGVKEILLRELGVSIEEVRVKNAKREISTSRQIIAFILFGTAVMRTGQIGEYINRDRTSVRYAVKNIGDLLESDPIVQEKVNSILNLIDKTNNENEPPSLADRFTFIFELQKRVISNRRRPQQVA